MTATLPALDPRLPGGDRMCAGEEPDPGRRAIAHALAMGFDNAEDCFRWLYDYGSEPLDPGRASARDATAPILSEPMRAMLSCCFQHHRAGVWDVWSRPGDARAPVWKAYLNPRFDDVRIFALRIGPALADVRVAAFKMVAQRWMALRPDKIIVYFQCRDDRSGWIAETLPLLSGIAANPVPFTTPHDTAGLVTVATDPADAPGQSWRSSLLRGIAEKIVSAGPADLRDLDADLRRTGIDPTTWEKHDGPRD